MSLKNVENFDLLSKKFDEICFKCLLIKKIDVDHCPVTDQCVYENHGFSKFLRMSIHRKNFRIIFYANSCFVMFLTICIISILRW